MRVPGQAPVRARVLAQAQALELAQERGQEPVPVPALGRERWAW